MKFRRTIEALLFFSASISFESAFASCDTQVNNTQKKLTQCITEENLMRHLKAFQDVADTNVEVPGTRFTGTSGYTGSVAYVISQMKKAGYKVSVQDIPMDISYTTVRQLDMVQPNPQSYVYLENFAPMTNTDGNNVTALVAIPTGNPNGCLASDWVGFPAGRIALVKRIGTSTSPGECPMRVKNLNAAQAGAVGVIAYRQDSGINTLTQYTLGDPPLTNHTPQVSVTRAVAEPILALINAGTPPTMHINIVTVRAHVVTQNVLAESVGGNPNNVIMAGAHLDSVEAGPGINDNGSGSAALIEIAIKLQKVKPVNKLRFAWWAAEELGDIGSYYYVEHLTPAEIGKIAFYFNTDMMGSPNGGREIMGLAEGVSPPGSELGIKLYEDFFKSIGLGYAIFDPFLNSVIFRSDQTPFLEVGIPISFVSSGADNLWTLSQALKMPDLAPTRIIGQPEDMCYHKPCDNINNIDTTLFKQMVQATAYAILTFGMNTQALNGKKGKGNFTLSNNVKMKILKERKNKHLED